MADILYRRTVRAISGVTRSSTSFYRPCTAEPVVAATRSIGRHLAFAIPKPLLAEPNNSGSGQPEGDLALSVIRGAVGPSGRTTRASPSPHGRVSPSVTAVCAAWSAPSASVRDPP